MDDIRFNWDETNNLANKQKYRVSFIEAKKVFFDDSARSINDPDHPAEENKFILLGISNRLRLLVVSYLYLRSDAAIQIIGARRATLREQQTYIQKILWEKNTISPNLVKILMPKR